MDDAEIRSLEFDGSPVSDDFLIEIGRTTVLWSRLEALLNLCLAKLAGFNDGNPIPFILFLHVSFPQRLDMLGTLCEQLVSNFPSLENYKTVIILLRSAQAGRNKYAHNGLMPDEEGNIVMAIGSARGKLKTSVEQVNVVDIRRVVIAIDEAHAALIKLVLGRDIGVLSNKLANRANLLPPDH